MNYTENITKITITFKCLLSNYMFFLSTSKLKVQMIFLTVKRDNMLQGISQCADVKVIGYRTTIISNY